MDRKKFSGDDLIRGQFGRGPASMSTLDSPPVRDFTGRGPRNYRRSDASIREDVCERLTRDGHLDPSDVEVMVVDGKALLTGTVGSRSDRRRAEDIAYDVFGVRDVDNKLRVGTVIHAPRPDISGADFDMPWPRGG